MFNSESPIRIGVVVALVTIGAGILSSLGCGHPYGIGGRAVSRNRVPGSEVFERGHAGKRILEAEWRQLEDTGYLPVSATLVLEGTEQVRVEERGKRNYRAFELTDLVGRPISAPFYIAVLGPLWDKAHDHNGNGKVDWYEYLREWAAQVNPLEGSPNSSSNRSEEIVLSTTLEAAPILRSDPLADLAVTAEIRCETESFLVEDKTDSQGWVSLDVADGLRALVGPDCVVNVTASPGAQAQSRRLSAVDVAEIVRKRFGNPSLATVPPRHRDSLSRAYRAAAEQAWDAGQMNVAFELLTAGGAISGVPAEREKHAFLSRRPIPFAAAVNAQLLDAAVVGSGIQSVSVNINRLSQHGFVLALDAGTFFVNKGSSQNMVATESYVIDLTDRRSITLSVDAACANMRRAIPSDDATFSVEMTPRSGELKQLAPHLRGERYPVIQAAVWIVTDDASRDDLGVLVARPVRAYTGGTAVISDNDTRRAAEILE